jgi:hypothetical protein
MHHTSRQQQQEQVNVEENEQHYTINEIGHELTSLFESMIDSVQTPFDIVCDICLFDNEAPTNEKQLELHCEKLDILIAIFKHLTHANIKLFEKFLKKLDQKNSLQELCTKNESSLSKLIPFVLDIASFCKTHFQQVKVNKYLIWQQVYYNYPNEAQAQSNDYSPA